MNTSEQTTAGAKEDRDEAIGQTLGRYKLLERVGEGGFGVVYVAEQREPLKRRVALKIIKLGMDTRATRPERGGDNLLKDGCQGELTKGRSAHSRLVTAACFSSCRRGKCLPALRFRVWVRLLCVLLLFALTISSWAAKRYWNAILEPVAVQRSCSGS